MTVALLPSSSTANSTHGGASPLAAEPAEGARFSDVLSRQGTTRPTQSSDGQGTNAGRANQPAPGHGSGTNRTQARATDHDESAQDAAQDPTAVLSLPDLALQIATQAAAVIERTRPGSARDSNADTTPDPSLASLGDAQAAMAAVVANNQSALSGTITDLKDSAASSRPGSRTSTATLLRKDIGLSQAALAGGPTGKTNASGASAAQSGADPSQFADPVLVLQTDTDLVNTGTRAPVQIDTTAPTFLPAGSLASASGTVSAQAGQAVTAGAITVPFQHPQWPQALGQQVLQLGQAGQHAPQIAELRLDPPDLGPLRISIQMTDNVAHAVFVSAHANVRNAIENALPQLQDQLAQAGISLGQTSVNDQGTPDQAFQAASGSARQTASGNGTDANDTVPSPATSPQRSVHPNALVDTFA